MVAEQLRHLPDRGGGAASQLHRGEPLERLRVVQALAWLGHRRRACLADAERVQPLHERQRHMERVGVGVGGCYGIGGVGLGRRRALPAAMRPQRLHDLPAHPRSSPKARP